MAKLVSSGLIEETVPGLFRYICHIRDLDQTFPIHVEVFLAFQNTWYGKWVEGRGIFPEVLVSGNGHTYLLLEDPLDAELFREQFVLDTGIHVASGCDPKSIREKAGERLPGTHVIIKAPSEQETASIHSLLVNCRGAVTIYGAQDDTPLCPVWGYRVPNMRDLESKWDEQNLSDEYKEIAEDTAWQINMWLEPHEYSVLLFAFEEANEAMMFKLAHGGQ